MPLELGPISVVGRIIDFSIPGTSRESMMPDYMHDILGLLIRALENVTQWIFDNAYRFDMQHKDNIAAIGISEAVLLRAAGAAQSLAGTSQAEFDKWWSEAPCGDDPVDQVWIKAGIDYAKSKGY